MIQSFGDGATEDLYNGVDSARARRLPNEIKGRGVSTLDRLDAATQVGDLRLPPSNNLEQLKGRLAGHWSICINDQWRIIFKWTDAGPAEVAIVDYH